MIYSSINWNRNWAWLLQILVMESSRIWWIRVLLAVDYFHDDHPVLNHEEDIEVNWSFLFFMLLASFYLPLRFSKMIQTYHRNTRKERITGLRSFYGSFTSIFIFITRMKCRCNLKSCKLMKSGKRSAPTTHTAMLAVKKK